MVELRHEGWGIDELLHISGGVYENQVEPGIKVMLVGVV